MSLLKADHSCGQPESATFPIYPVLLGLQSALLRGTAVPSLFSALTRPCVCSRCLVTTSASLRLSFFLAVIRELDVVGGGHGVGRSYSVP